METQSQTLEPALRSGEEERLGVLLEDPDTADVLDVGEALRAALDLPLADATHRARYAHGVLLTDADPSLTRRLLAQLDQRGVSAFSIPASSIQGVPEETRVKEVRLEPEVLQVVPWSPTGFARVPWSQIEAISVYAIAEAVEARERSDRTLHAIAERSLRPGLVRVLDEIHERRGRGVEIHIRSDLVCPAADSLLRLDRDCRIVGQPEEEAKVHSLERYLRFLDEAIARSGAYLPAVGLDFLAEPQVRSILLAKEEERHNINLWLWQMIVSGRLEGQG